MAQAQLKVRMPEPLRGALEEAARQRRVSMNSETVRRLERSFTEEAAFGTPATKQVAYLAASAFALAGQFRGANNEDWIKDPSCYRAGLFAAIDALLSMIPDATAEEVALEIEVLKGRLLTRIVRQEQDK